MTSSVGIPSLLHPRRDIALRVGGQGPPAFQLSWGEGSRREHLTTDSAELAVLLTAMPFEITVSTAESRLAACLSCPPEEASELLAQFVELGLFTAAPAESSPGEQAWLDVEWDDALQFHRATRDMIWSHDYSGAPKVMTRYHVDQNVRPTTPPPLPWRPPVIDTIDLPDPMLPHSSFEEVAAARRTARNFHDTHITLADLATVLGLTFGRRYPQDDPAYHSSQTYSRGEPFSAYVILSGSGVPQHVPANPGVYHYDPENHRLGLARSASGLGSLDELLWGQTYGNDAPAMLVMCADWPQFSWKYRFSRAYRFVYVECGSFMQTALMLAGTLGLRAFATPAIDDRRMCDVLGVDESRVGPIYIATMGRAPGHPTS